MPIQQHKQLVINLSTKSLSEEMTGILARGLNFALVPNGPPVKGIVCGVVINR